MANAVDKILLLPRFTAFCGVGPYYTAPMNVRAYRQAFITAWAGKGVGSTSSTAGITVQESTDLLDWNDLDGISLTADAEAQGDPSFSLEWMRLKIDITGAWPAVTLWAVGNFVLRET